MGIDCVREGDLMQALVSTPATSVDVVVAFDVIEHSPRISLCLLWARYISCCEMATAAPARVRALGGWDDYGARMGKVFEEIVGRCGSGGVRLDALPPEQPPYLSPAASMSHREAKRVPVYRLGRIGATVVAMLVLRLIAK